MLLQILSFEQMLNFPFLPWMEICQTTWRQRGASGGELKEGFPLSSRHANLEIEQCKMMQRKYKVFKVYSVKLRTEFAVKD